MGNSDTATELERQVFVTREAWLAALEYGRKLHETMSQFSTNLRVLRSPAVMNAYRENGRTTQRALFAHQEAKRNLAEYQRNNP